MNEHLNQIQSDLLDDQVFYTRMATLHAASARAFLIAAVILLPATLLVFFDALVWQLVLLFIGLAIMGVGKFIAWRASQFEKSYQVKVPLDV